MTYYIIDDVDFVCDLGTSEGLKELSQFCPEFIESGETEDLETVAAALEQVDRPEDAEKIRAATPPLLITDGVVDEE